MLNFRGVNAKAKVVNVTVKNGYSLVKMKSGKQNKTTKEWSNSTWSFIRFVFTANEKIDQLLSELENLEKFDGGDAKQGVSIILKSVSLENAPYMKEGVSTYPKNWQMTVWDWNFPDTENNSSSIDDNPKVESDDEMPF
jgi:hypothetical protein